MRFVLVQTFLAYNHFSNACQSREISVHIAADYNSAAAALVNQAVGLLYLISGSRVFCLKPFCLGWFAEVIQVQVFDAISQLGVPLYEQSCAGAEGLPIKGVLHLCYDSSDRRGI